MAQYSKKERLLASFLSRTPLLKSWIKYLYSMLCYMVYRKPYQCKILFEGIDIKSITNTKAEDFGGYYDHPTMMNGKTMTIRPTIHSTKTIKQSSKANIYVYKYGKSAVHVAETSAFNWQQGCRSLWIDDDTILFNDYDKINNKYVSKAYSVSNNVIKKQYQRPVQDIFGLLYFLSVNVERISCLHPEYGYSSKSVKYSDLPCLENDGIWKIDVTTGEESMVLTIKEVVEKERKQIFSVSNHFVNHLQISPDGSRFIFIHRYFEHGRRHDRLMIYDYSSLNVIVDEDYVSHCHWIDSSRLIGYFRYGGKNAYFVYDVINETFEEQVNLGLLNLGDGHPTCFRNWVAIDSYPDKSRVQHLVLYNIESKKTYPILELLHPMKYFGATRCDLHPRFSDDGTSLTIDSVYKGERHQYVIDLGNFYKLVEK